MRVLYLTMNPNRASTTVPTEGWFVHLRPTGLEPVVVSSKAGAFQTWAEAQGIPCYEVPLPFPDKRKPFPFLSGLARVLIIALRHRVELLHCNEQDVYPIGQYAARLLRIPVVVSVHSAMREGFSEWAFQGAKRPNRIFFVSAGNREMCRPGLTGVVPEDRWRVLHNGLDLQRYQPDVAAREAFRREHGAGASLLIGVASALRPGKQIEHLFQAAQRLTTPHVKVVVAGGPVAGDEAYAAGLLAMGRDLLGDRLIYLGHQQDLRPMLNGLDVFVNTSKEEAFGISVLEAMALGCPVVGYPSVAVSEVVLPGGGVIVPQDDVEAVARALDACLADREGLVRSRPSARQRATHFDIDRLAKQLWTEYQLVLREKTDRAAPKPFSAQAR